MNNSRFTVVILAAAALALSACGGGAAGGSDDDSGGEVVDVELLAVEQVGGVSYSADTTALLLTFDRDPKTLTAADVAVSGAVKGALTGHGTTRALKITGIAVADGADVSLTVASPKGYSIAGSTQTAVVYRLLDIGVEYLGGKIAYILQPGDAGYDAAVRHGLIAAAANQSAGAYWWNGVDGTYPAAEAAAAYDGGGFSDWYLPSKDELNKLYLNQVKIGGFGTGYDTNYWSSTSGGGGAWAQSMWDGYQYAAPAINTFRVRAVRVF